MRDKRNLKKNSGQQSKIKFVRIFQFSICILIFPRVIYHHFYEQTNSRRDLYFLCPRSACVWLLEMIFRRDGSCWGRKNIWVIKEGWAISRQLSLLRVHLEFNLKIWQLIKLKVLLMIPRRVRWEGVSKRDISNCLSFSTKIMM